MICAYIMQDGETKKRFLISKLTWETHFLAMMVLQKQFKGQIAENHYLHKFRKVNPLCRCPSLIKKSFFLVLRAKEYRCHHAMLSCLLCLNFFFYARFSSKSEGKIKYTVNVHKVGSYMQNLGKPPLKNVLKFWALPIYRGGGCQRICSIHEIL